jgi:hypothetical protein
MLLLLQPFKEDYTLKYYLLSSLPTICLFVYFMLCIAAVMTAAGSGEKKWSDGYGAEAKFHG